MYCNEYCNEYCRRFFYFLECVNNRICAITYPTIKFKCTLLLISTSLVLLLIVILVVPIFHFSESGSGTMGTIVKLVLATVKTEIRHIFNEKIELSLLLTL